jgi:hypothetical protein
VKLFDFTGGCGFRVFGEVSVSLVAPGFEGEVDVFRGCYAMAADVNIVFRRTAKILPKTQKNVADAA